MFRQILIMAALIVTGGSALAQAVEQEKIYGSQYMTQQQRAEYRSRLLAANTEQERDQLRKEHSILMKKRARERGTMLPDSPAAKSMSPPIIGMGQG